MSHDLVVVVDYENESAFGPYESIEKAAEAILEMANKDGWTDVLVSQAQDGTPFAGGIDGLATADIDVQEFEQRLLEEFFGWLHTNTDTFDEVIVGASLDLWMNNGAKEPGPLGFDEKERTELIEDFIRFRSTGSMVKEEAE